MTRVYIFPIWRACVIFWFNAAWVVVCFIIGDIVLDRDWLIQYLISISSKWGREKMRETSQLSHHVGWWNAHEFNPLGYKMAAASGGSDYMATIIFWLRKWFCAALVRWGWSLLLLGCCHANVVNLCLVAFISNSLHPSEEGTIYWVRLRRECEAC